MKDRGRRWALLLVTMLVAAACGGGGGGGGDEDTVTFGFSSDLSGAFANLSRPILAGTRAYIEKVNREGGVDGAQIRLEVRDDRLDVQTGTADIRALADMGVPVILGNVSSVVWASTARLAEELEVPQIAGGAVDAYVYPPQPYLYRYLMSSRQSARGMLNFAFDQVGEDAAVAAIRYESAGTDAWEEAVIEALDEVGKTLVAAERFPTGSTDVTPAASAVAASNPDFVVASLNDNQAPLVVDALRNHGYQGPVINWVGIAESTLAAVNDPAFYVLRDTVPPAQPEASALVEAAEAAGVADDLTHDFASNGYLAAKVAVEALAACGVPCSGPDMNGAIVELGDIDTEGLAGPGFGNVSEDSHLFTRTVSVWHKEPGDPLSSMVGDWFEPSLEDVG